MFHGFGLRTLTAIAIVALSAVAAALLNGNLETGLVVIVGGVAAVLLAVGTGEAVEIRHVPAPPPPRDSAPVDVGEAIEAIVTPIMIVTGGRVSHANAAARALLGGHVIGEDVRLAIRHPAAAERLTGGRAATNGAPISLVGLGTLDQRWEMHVAPLSNDRRIVHLIDQTGSYAAERIRVDFVANASHELRTPLASILGFIETLSDGNAGDDPNTRARFLKVMFDEARRMQRLIEDLISLSRIEAEKYRVPQTEIDIAELLEEVRVELTAMPDKRASDLIVDIEGPLPGVIGDRPQLSQLLHNIIVNAMKYGRPGTPIEVRLWSDQTGMVRLSVADQGEGIPAEHIPRLTERFYRVDSGRSRALGGTGLGLAIVKHIVERHRGRLDIASVVGKGTIVSVLLPPAPHKPALSSKGNATVTEPRRSK